MFKQTIALFQYQLLGIINAKMWLLIFMVYVAAFLGGQFIAELAIINSEVIALAVMADFLRYCLALVVIISVCYQVTQDYELSQFERLMSMPISRGQYILAQLVVLAVFVLLLIIPLFVLMLFVGQHDSAWYWSMAVSLELLLIGQFAVLAAISLEKLPVAVIFTLAFYLLSKASPLLDLMFAQSAAFYEQEEGFQLTRFIFELVQYVLPDASAFAQNNMLFGTMSSNGLLIKQLITVVLYGLFIQFIIYIDFYRKEFNQS